MKRQKITVLLVGLILLFAFTNNIQSQWVQSNGPIGGNVRQLVFNASNDVFIATNGGVFGFLSNGSSWYTANSGLTTLDIRAVAVIGSNVFSGGYEVPNTPGGVFLSTNKGNSWTPVNTGLNNRTILSLGVNGTRLFAGTNGAGVYTTTNNGTSWTVANGGLSGSSLNINCIYTNSSVVYAGTNDGLAISTNNGTNWTVSSSGLSTNYKAIYAVTINSGTIFVGTKAGVYTSTNNGASFTPTSGSIGNANINCLLYDGTYVFAGTQGGVFKTSNNGANWVAANSGLTNLSVTTIANIASPVYTYIGTQGSGMFYSLNYSTWVNPLVNLYNTSPKSMCIKDGNVYTGTYLNGMYKTTNTGGNWTAINTGLPASSVVNDVITDGTNIYAATATGLYKTANDGASWTGIGTTITPTNYFLSVIKVGSVLYGGTFGGGVFTSTNEGANWTAMNSGLTNLNVWDLDYDASNIYAATASGGVFKYPLAGTSWVEANNGLPTGFDIRMLTVTGSKVYAGFIGLYVSTDGGSSWTSTANDSLAGKRVRCVYSFDGGNKLLVGTYNNGVYVSINGGANFYSANYGLHPLSDVNCITLVNGTDVFAGVYGLGIWKRPLAEIISGIKLISTEIPDKFKLGQNYPNPFNPVTNIKFEVPSTSNVVLKVYSSTGKEVSTIVNGLYRTGIYEATFDASGLSSGVYFYKLITDKFTQTKKMIVLK
ncbi:MAG TPA: T9SS type A sorting domain-containing protein [Ignavibacteria bacterium]|nr:T9SS type A sorting domain-containing protein [Ignavibacteria bacterium]